jgi:hypothetical protein
MLPLTHAWSRAQKCLLIAAVLIALAAFGTLVYSVERRYHPPDGNILAGTWEMTAPYSKDSSTVLRLARSGLQRGIVELGFAIPRPGSRVIPR